MRFVFFFVVFLSSGIAVQASMTKDIYISADIVKNQSSSSIALEFERRVYTALYSTEEQTFDDLTVPFTIRSPDSVTQLYSLHLIQSEHECSSSIQVATYIDGTMLSVGDTMADIPYNTFGNGEVWREHALTLSFPIISQDTTEQVCHGIVGLWAELQI